MHIWMVLIREHEDESVCGFSSINEGLGWRRFALDGDGEEDGIQVLIYWIICTVWVFIPIDLPRRPGIWRRKKGEPG
jgi:hypothetical protein